MSNLDAAIEQQGRLSKATSKDKNLSKPRLVADPTVGTRDLVQVLRSFLSHKGTTDLHSLVTPGKYTKISWKSPLDGEWLEKMASMAFDFAQVAPNSKLSGKKMREAISQLMDSGEVKNTTAKDRKTFVDSLDLTIRMAMAQYRQAKADLSKREIMLKRLSKDGSQRIKMVLDRLLLPKDYVPEDESDEDAEVKRTGLDSETSSQLVLASPEDVVHASGSVHAAPSSSCDVDDYNLEFFSSVAATPLAKAPATPPRAPSKSGVVGFSPGEDFRSHRSSGSVGFGLSSNHELGSENCEKTGKITPKSLDQQFSKVSSNVSKPESANPKTKTHERQGELKDDDLLLEAEKHVPQKSMPKPEKSKAKKKPAAASSSCKKRPASAVVPGPDDVSSEKKKTEKSAEKKKPADKKDSKNNHCHPVSISCIY